MKNMRPVVMNSTAEYPFTAGWPPAASTCDTTLAYTKLAAPRWIWPMRLPEEGNFLWFALGDDARLLMLSDRLVRTCKRFASFAV
jgi:hypothetical protein